MPHDLVIALMKKRGVPMGDEADHDGEEPKDGEHEAEPAPNEGVTPELIECVKEFKHALMTGTDEEAANAFADCMDIYESGPHPETEEHEPPMESGEEPAAPEGE